MSKITNEKLIKEVEEIIKPLREEINELKENKNDLDFSWKIWYQGKLSDKNKQEFARHLQDLMKEFKIQKVISTLYKKL